MSNPHEDLIRKRAFDLWEGAGRPEGKDLDLWLAAERDVLAEIEKLGAGAGETKLKTPRKRAATPRKKTKA